MYDYLFITIKMKFLCNGSGMKCSGLRSCELIPRY